MKKVLIALGVILLAPVVHAQGVDTSFASSGQFTLELGGASSTSPQVIRQADGKIVSLAVTPADNGVIASRNIVVTRLTARGQLDPTFGMNGVAVIDLAGRDDRASRIVQQADGKLVITGATVVNTDSISPNLDGIVLRLNQDGSLDSSFNGTGFLAIRLAQDGLDDNCGTVALRSDGMIFTTCTQFGFTSVFVVRVMPNGVMDVNSGYAFQTGGIANASLPLAITQPADIAFDQISGAVTIAGTYRSAVDSTMPSRIYLYRLTGTGIPDPDFGLRLLEFPGPLAPYQATGLLRDPQGRLVVTGLQADLSAATLMPVPFIARFTRDGNPDGTFGGGGRVEIVGSVSFSAATALALQSDGKLLIGGFASRSLEVGGLVDPFVLRVTDDGRFDTTFAAGAGLTRVTLNDSASTNRAPLSIALAPGGKVILGGAQDAGTVDTARAFVIQVAPGSVGFSMDSVSTSEGAGSVQLTLMRSIDTRSAGSVRVQTFNGSATAGDDFTAVDQTVIFAAGEVSKVISITLNGDSVDEPDEMFSVSLTSSDENLVVDRGTATVSIMDDDAAVQPTPGQPQPPAARRRGGGGGALGLDILLLLGLLALASRAKLRVAKKVAP